MAMASGTDPLDRLQVGARALRAEREHCHAAADRACRTETGAAFSTVMGKKVDEDAFVTQMEQELAGTLYFDETLLSSLEAAHQDPAMSADDIRDEVINAIATTLQPWCRNFCTELKKQILAQVAAAYDKEGQRRAVSKRTLSDHMDGLDTITDGIVETSMEIYEAANPIGSKRREVIETFDSEVMKASMLLVRKANQEAARNRQQNRVDAYQAALDELGEEEEEDEEYERTTRLMDSAQTRRDQCDREVKTLTATIARTFHFEKVEGVKTTQVEVKPLKLPDNLNKDKGSLLAPLITGWADKFASKYYVASMFLARMVGDFDPTTKRWWYPKREDYPQELLLELDSQFAEFDKDILSSVTPANKTTLTTSPITWGTGAYKRDIEVKEGYGMARVYGILSKYVDVSTSNEETMLDKLAEGAEGFKAGNPATKITNTYRPSLERAMELGVRDIKWSTYGDKFCKALAKRGCDELKALVTEDRFKQPTNPNDSGPLVETLFNEVVAVCDQLKEENKSVSPKDFWEAHPYQSILTRIGAKVAKTQDAAGEAEEEAPTCNKRNARKKRKKAKQKGEEGGEDVVAANLAKGGKGHHDKQGKGGKSSKGAKGGRGSKPTGNTTTPSSKVLCDSRTCTRMVNPRRDVPNPLLCAQCTKFQEDNLGRFGPYYLNRQFQQRDFVSKERPAEGESRGRKRDRYSDRERPSRRHSEGDRARSSKDYDTKRGYSATVEKLTTALDTALDTIKALKPKASTRSRSRSRSNQRFRRSRSREEESDESPRRYR